jgi:pyruvate formate lyase activating enzyme
MKRRSFLQSVGASVAAIPPGTGLFPLLSSHLNDAATFAPKKKLALVPARHFKKIKGNGVECGICPRHCRVPNLARGYCGVRENNDGTYYSLVYGRPCAINVDPIEKKPFFHFYPGTTAYSIATAGCNVECKACQNWEISQSRPEQTENIEMSPQEVVAACRRATAQTIAYTYSEPIVFYEYMYDTAKAGRDQGIRSVMVSNGYMEATPQIDLLSHLDAVKIDLKAIRPQFYREFVLGELKPVLDSLLRIRASGVWLEIVYLVIPTLNDSDAEFTELARWIKTNLGADVPLHFSRFHPQYLLKNLPMTPQKTLERALHIARAEGLHYVYLGNLPGHEAESTYCPGCGAAVISRSGYSIPTINLNGNRCRACKREIPGRFAG